MKQQFNNRYNKDVSTLSFFCKGEAGRSLKDGGFKFIEDDERAWWLSSRRQRLQ